MDQHVLDFMKPLSDKELDQDYYNYLIKKIKNISNNDIKGFMNKISKTNNKISDVDNTLFLISIIAHCKKISQKDKLVIFYYVYKYHKIVLNNNLVNLKKKEKMIDIEYNKPNSYTGYYQNREYQIKILIDEDSELLKIYKNYKIMEMYNIPLPDLSLDYTFGNYKTLVISKNSKITKKEDKKIIFIEIMNILRLFNKNKFFVSFDFWNIRKIRDRYYLLNLTDIKKVKKADIKKQLDMLKTILNYPNKIINYDYSRLLKDLIQN